MKAPKVKVSSSNDGRIPPTSTPPKGMSGIGSITNAMMQKNTNTLAHRISRIIQAITADKELQKRFKRPDESMIQMGQRIREDNNTEDTISNLESKLEEFGVVF